MQKYIKYTHKLPQDVKQKIRKGARKLAFLNQIVKIRRTKMAAADVYKFDGQILQNYIDWEYLNDNWIQTNLKWRESFFNETLMKRGRLRRK